MLELKPNMSLTDRIIRSTVGITLLLIGPLTSLVETDMFSNVLLGTVAVLALISAVSAYCFLYDITGFNTVREK